ncbi:hypothetical protein [Nostoc sp.]
MVSTSIYNPKSKIVRWFLSLVVRVASRREGLSVRVASRREAEVQNLKFLASSYFQVGVGATRRRHRFTIYR